MEEGGVGWVKKKMKEPRAHWQKEEDTDEK